MSGKPLVLIIITKSDLGGAQIHTLGLIKSLKQDFEFVLATGEAGYLTREAEKLDIKTIVLKSLIRPIRPGKDIAGYREIKSLLNQMNPDIVHLHSSKAGVLGRLASWRAKKTCLFTAHGWAFTEGAGFKQRSYGWVVEWLLAHICDGIITVSDYDYGLAQRLGVGSPKKMWTVKNCIGEFSGLEKLEGSASEPVRLLNIGRMSRAKNQSMLLQAAANIKLPFALDIVGDGHLRPGLENQRKALNLDNKVNFVGAVESVSEFFSSAGIFVLSSDYEGLPLSVLEAMSAGLPVVATRVGGVEEAVIDGQTGYLVERGDSNSMAQQIEVLLRDPDKRAEMGHAARTRYEQKFTLERMTSATADIYKRLLR